MLTEAQQMTDRIRGNECSIEELTDCIRRGGLLVRTNALEALVIHAQKKEDLIDELVAAASDPINQTRLMGTVSVAHVAIACLLRVGTSKSFEKARALIQSWPEPDRTDLIWYLRSENLPVK